MSTVATIHSETLGLSLSARAELSVVEGPDLGRATVLEGPCVVGTDHGADLCLTDPRVSRRHLRVTPDGGSFVVADLESRNGTFYAGGRVANVRVSAGATLRVGQTSLRINPLAQPIEIAPSQARRFGEMVGESLSLREVFAVLELAAKSDVTVLLEGETGVGKELAARALHDSGARAKGPFVALDCSSLPEGLVESELFGHVRGAFTGASQARDGAFVRASSGTLVLDELDSIAPMVQARLLRAVEERTVRPVGSDHERAVDVRLVAASRRDLATLVAEGSFRADLFYRLSVVRVRIPPLRDRREDVALTARAILRARGLDDAGEIDGPGLARLFAHDWPGNARELRNVLDRALVLSPNARSFRELRISLEGTTGQRDGLAVRADLPFHVAKQQLTDAFERRYLEDCLARHEGNVSAAAREAGLDRKHFRRLADKHDLLKPRRGG